VTRLTNFIVLLKATRVYRTLPVLMVIMVSAAFANIINKEIIVLGISCILVYAAAAMHNAIRDKDYKLPQYSKKVMFILLFAAVILSLSNYVILFTVITWIFLGFIYNTIARSILFGDTTILSITHFALPSFSSSILLGLDFRLTILLSGFFFLLAWFITQTKNLKDTQEDKNRNYTTLTTKFLNGSFITKIFLFISFAFMVGSYFLFNLTIKFIGILSVIFLLIIVAMRKINNNGEKQGLSILRLVILIFMLGLIIEKTSNYFIVSLGLFLCFSYLLFLGVSNINRLPSIIKKEFRTKLGLNNETSKLIKS